MARVRARMRFVDLSTRQKVKARLSNMNAGAERSYGFFHGGPAVKQLGKEAVLYRRPLEPRIRGR